MKQLVGMRPIHPDPAEEEKIKNSILDNARKAYVDYNNFILFNGIYFSEELADKLENIRRQYFSAQWDLYEPQRLESMGLTKHQAYKSSGQTVIDASKKIRDEIPKVLKEVEKELVTLKNLKTREQKQLTIDQLLNEIS